MLARTAARALPQLADARQVQIAGYHAESWTDMATERPDLADMLGVVAAEADWLAKGDDARFMSEVAMRMQE